MSCCYASIGLLPDLLLAEGCANIMLGICKQYRVDAFDELTNHINFSKGIIFSNSYNYFSSCAKKKRYNKI